MKRITVILLAIALVMACKKNGSDKPLLLSKVYVNNLLSVEYTYSTDRKPVRRDLYGTGSGQSVFAGMRLYEYANGNMSEVKMYNSGNTLIDRLQLTYDVSGNLTRIDRYGNDDELDAYSVFQYSADQFLSKVIHYTTNPTKKTGEIQVVNNAQGQIVSFKRFWQNGGSLNLSDSTTVENSSRTLPAHWDFYEMIPYEFPAEYTFFGMTMSSWYYYMPGGPPTYSTTTFSDRQYNDAGYLISQVRKLEGHNGISYVSSNQSLKYEYIE